MKNDLIYLACRRNGARPGPWREDEVRLVSRYDIELSCKAKWDCERWDDMLARMGEADACVYEEVEVDQDATKLAQHPAYEALACAVEKYIDAGFTSEYEACGEFTKALERIAKTPRVWIETWRKGGVS